MNQVILRDMTLNYTYTGHTVFIAVLVLVVVLQSIRTVSSIGLPAHTVKKLPGKIVKIITGTISHPMYFTIMCKAVNLL